MEGRQKGYVMRDWQLFSTTDMTHWTQHPCPLSVFDFKWATSKQAYAGHVAKRNGKYYFYVSTNGSGIGVAVSDKITGPYKDAIGKPLLTRQDCFDSKRGWCCIDPAIVQYKGQWLFFSHNGGLPEGGSFSRSVVCEPLYNNTDGSIRNIPSTTKGTCGLFNK